MVSLILTSNTHYTFFTLLPPFHCINVFVHTADVDYVSALETFILNNGNREECLDVATLDDGIVEEQEMFSVFLAVSDSTVEVVRSNSTGVIVDRDGRFLQQLAVQSVDLL